MNKAELIEQLARVTKLPKASAKKCVEAFMSIVGQSLKQNKHVVLTGFGSFVVAKRKPRVGVNPATGQKMQIPGRRVPKFRPGKALKDLVS
jgi:DNA-binding protein HU-beta